MEVTFFQRPHNGIHELLASVAFWREFLSKREEIEERYASELRDLNSTLREKLVHANSDDIEDTELLFEVRNLLRRIEDEEENLSAMVKRAKSVANTCRIHFGRLEAFQDLPADEVKCSTIEKVYNSARQSMDYRILKAGKRRELFEARMAILINKEKRFFGTVKPVDYLLRFEGERFLHPVEKTQEALAKYTRSLQKCRRIKDCLIAVSSQFNAAWKTLEMKRCMHVMRTLRSFYRVCAELEGSEYLKEYGENQDGYKEAEIARMLDMFTGWDLARITLPEFKDFSSVYSIKRILSTSLPEALTGATDQSPVSSQTAKNLLGMTHDYKELASALYSGGPLIGRNRRKLTVSDLHDSTNLETTRDNEPFTDLSIRRFALPNTQRSNDEETSDDTLSLDEVEAAPGRPDSDKTVRRVTWAPSDTINLNNN